MPSIRGIRRSISTTSGSCSAASASASSPSAAVATSSIPSSSPTSMPRPSRTTRWSSANSTRITSEAVTRAHRGRNWQAICPRQWKPQFDAEAVVGRAGVQAPAEQLGPLAHAGQPVAAAADHRRGGAVVLDGQRGAVVLVGELELDAVRRGVAAHVGERLLGGAVEGEARFRGRFARRAGDGQGRAREGAREVLQRGQVVAAQRARSPGAPRSARSPRDGARARGPRRPRGRRRGRGRAAACLRAAARVR